MSETPSTRTLLEFALDAAWQAGRITLGYYQTNMAADRKADNSMVTIADKLAEQKLRQLIEERWPDHGIIGEEYGDSNSDAPYTWTIDPIDGTRSFVSGVPLFSTLVALLDGNRPLVGVIHLPALNETIYAARGDGCYWNGRRVHVSSIDKLEDAMLLISGLNHFTSAEQVEGWQKLIDATYAQRTWGDAYGYALVASGRAEIMVDPAMHLWDCGPMQVILEEAGGHFTDWRGNATIHAGESIVTNEALFEPVMELIGQPTI